MTFRPIALGLALICAPLGVGQARAQVVSISGLYNTGVDNSGVQLGNNIADTHYVVTSSPAAAPANNEGNAMSVSNGGQPNDWMDNPSGARWITTPGTPTNGSGIGGANPRRVSGNFDYTLTFTMPGNAEASPDLSSVSITGSFAADDTVSILVNDAEAVKSTGNKDSLTSFSLSSSNAAFTTGTNTITFRVYNASNKSNSGLLVTGLTGNVWVPEVGAVLPTATAMAIGIASAWRLGRRSSRDRR